MALWPPTDPGEALHPVARFPVPRHQPGTPGDEWLARSAKWPHGRMRKRLIEIRRQTLAFLLLLVPSQQH